MPDDQSTPQNQGSEQSTTESKKVNPAEKRINQLYARAATAEERVDALEVQLQTLQAQNQELQRANLIAQGHQSQTQADPAVTGTETELTGASDIRGVIKDEIRGAMGSLREEMLAERAQAQLMDSHRQSLRMAVNEAPELADQSSQLWKYVDHVFRSDANLRSDPNGPLKALYQVQGMMVSGGNTEATTERKAAATVPTGTGSIAQDGTAANIEELRADVASIKKDMHRNAGDPAQLWTKLRNAQFRLAKAEGKDLGPVVSQQNYK